jgi:hypothetical protein
MTAGPRSPGRRAVGPPARVAEVARHLERAIGVEPERHDRGVDADRRDLDPDRRQRVLDSASRVSARPARDEAVALERAQRMRQRLLRDLADLVEDLVVAPRAGREEVEDPNAPLAGQHLEHGAGAVDHLELADVLGVALSDMVDRACGPRRAGQADERIP